MSKRQRAIFKVIACAIGFLAGLWVIISTVMDGLIPGVPPPTIK